MTSSIEENLRTALSLEFEVNQYIDDRIHYARVPQNRTLPHIWFIRSGENTPLSLDGQGGTHETRFDLECISDDLVEAMNVSRATKNFLHGYRGVLGDGTVQGIFVEDKDDNYIPKSIGSDEGFHVSALTVTTWHND